MKNSTYRKDVYESKPYYGQLCTFCSVGITTVPFCDLEELKTAIYDMGYETIIERVYEGKVYLIG